MLVRGDSIASNDPFFTEPTKHGEPFCTSSGRFDYTELSPPPGEQGGCALERGGSTSLNHLE